MIAEWFFDRLARSGHRRIGSFRSKEPAYTNADRALRLLKAHDVPYVITTSMDDRAVARCEEVMAGIEEQELDFGTWCSFRDETTIYFVFRFEDSATQFRLMLPD